MKELCSLFGYKRQSQYKFIRKEKMVYLQAAIVLKLVDDIRQELPKIGTKKIFHMIKEPLREHGIKMGRDKLFTLFADHGLLIRRKKRRPMTTDSDHPFFKYGNLVRGFIVSRINQVWVSDITYLHLQNGFAYLSLITDVYSRKIVGHCLYHNLSTIGSLNALRMAVSEAALSQSEYLIHHSDRGLQYCCSDYITLLRDHFIAISMTQNGDPYENAIAERVNGILKSEFGLYATFKSVYEATVAVDIAVKNYNMLRPHMSLQLQTPNAVHHFST
jgi:transposase InsO family protein